MKEKALPDFSDKEKKQYPTLIAEWLLSGVSDPSLEYQYGWRIYPSQECAVDNHHFSARGNLGQFIYIVPEERLVIVRHGYDFGNVNWINLFESISKAIS